MSEPVEPIQELGALDFALLRLDWALEDEDDGWNLGDLAIVTARLGDARRHLDLLLTAAAQRLGELMGKREVPCPGVGVLVRSRDRSRRNWDHENLLRLVLDSRVVDQETGEIESHLDAVRAVYGLKGYQARIGELKARGIEVDEFCETEDRGWKVTIR